MSITFPVVDRNKQVSNQQLPTSFNETQEILDGRNEYIFRVKTYTSSVHLFEAGAELRAKSKSFK